MLIQAIKKKLIGDKPSKKIKSSTASKKIKHKIPLAYVYVYYKLREILKNRCTITFLQTSEVLNALQMTIKIPKRLKYLILAEMEEYELLKRINHQRYWISNKSSTIKELKRITDVMKGSPFW
jgi:hypothetical protein